MTRHKKKKVKEEKPVTGKGEYVKKEGRVVGIVMTPCPSCNNLINFDRRDSRVCPYCEINVQIDLNRIEVYSRILGSIEQ